MAVITMDELAGDSEEPVSTKTAVTKFNVVIFPARNESVSDVNAMNIAFFASGVTKMEKHFVY